MPVPKKLFYSYSHADQKLRDNLAKHLVAYRNQKLIEDWYDRKLPAGVSIDESIAKKLDSADIVLLLVSPDFLSSGYCQGIELPQALEQHEKGKTRVIPVILRRTPGWEKEPFGHLNPLPTNGRAAIEWPRNDGFCDIAIGVKTCVEKLEQTSEGQPREHFIEVELGEFVCVYDAKRSKTRFDWEVADKDVEPGLPTIAKEWKELHTRPTNYLRSGKIWCITCWRPRYLAGRAIEKAASPGQFKKPAGRRDL